MLLDLSSTSLYNHFRLNLQFGLPDFNEMIFAQLHMYNTGQISNNHYKSITSNPRDHFPICEICDSGSVRHKKNKAKKVIAAIA